MNLMQVTVKKRFRDATSPGIIREPGEVLKLTQQRIDEILSVGDYITVTTETPKRRGRKKNDTESIS